MLNQSEEGSHRGGPDGSPHSESVGRRSSRISKTRFPGSSRYAVYHRGKPRYFYAYRNYEPKYDFKRLLIGIIYIPFLLFIALSVKQSFFKVPKDYNHNIVISDDADVIADEWALQDSLKGFMEKTGVTPSVITLFDDDWNGNYLTLVQYANARYSQEFNDEMHWLIVYSRPKVYTADGAVEWRWEERQGEDAAPALKGRGMQKFNSTMQELLGDGSVNVGTAISKAFDSFTDNVSVLPHLSVLIMPLFMLAFLLFHAYFMLGLNELKYRKAVPAPEEGIDDVSGTAYGDYEIKDKIASAKNRKICPYCGGSYSQVLTRCPHCNAMISEE